MTGRAIAQLVLGLLALTLAVAAWLASNSALHQSREACRQVHCWQVTP